MESQFQNSFIPKKPIATVRPMQSVGSRISLFSIFATLCFIVFLALAGGVFFWQKYLGQSIKSMNAEIVKAKDSLQPALIESLVRLNNRIEVGKELLNRHISISDIFAHIGSYTLKSVRFQNFEYGIDRTTNTISIRMSGEADGFGAVAQQSDEFAKSKYIRNVLITDLNLDRVGHVSFRFSGSVDPTFLSYAKKVREVEVNNSANTSTDTSQNTDTAGDDFADINADLGGDITGGIDTSI